MKGGVGVARKPVSLRIKCTVEEMAIFQRAANARGIDLSLFVRYYLLLVAAMKVEEMHNSKWLFEFEAVEEMKRIIQLIKQQTGK